MDMSTWMIAFLIIFMLHNLEEIITIETWMNKTYPQISHKIPSLIQKEIEKFKHMTAIRFSVVVFVLSIACSAVILIAAITQHYYFFLGLSLFFAINIFTHPLQSLYLKCYTPGVWTTITLIIPYYILFSFNILKSNLLTTNTIVGSFVVMLLFIPVFIFSQMVGEKWNSHSNHSS